MSQDQPAVVRRPLKYPKYGPSSRRSRTMSVRQILAVALAFLVTVGSLAGLTQLASAATPGISSSILLNGQKYNGTDVVNEGDIMTLRVQYDTNVVPGSTVVFELGANVTVTGVPAANTAIQSVTQSGNQVSITFRDPWPPAVNQGVFDLKFSVNQVTESTLEPITWTVNGEQSSVNVIIRNTGDAFANVTNGSAKSVSPTNLDSYVSVSDAGVVTVNPTIANAELTYTLSLDSEEARSGFAITDSLPASMEYIAGSFAATITTWDSNGLNQSTDPFTFSPTVTGNSFTSSVNVPGAGARDADGPSKLRITYKAKVSAAQVGALQTLLQAQHDALGGDTGNFQTTLVNTANFGGTDRTASVRLRGTVPGVGVGDAFGKNASWSTRNVVTDEAGNLTPPADLTYTLKADLRPWDGHNAHFTLSQNVVISDVLPSQASWNTADASFITPTGIALTSVSPCPATVTDFADDAYVGTYCVDGQRLLINVGKNNTTNASIAVKAQLNTVTGLTQTGTTTVEGGLPYRWPNTANFYYRSGSPYSADRDVTVVVLPDTSGGINDSSVFNKSGTPRDTTVDPGDTVIVDYTFTLAAGKGIDVRTSQIVDYIDSDIFDLGDLSGVAISGTYDGQTLNSTHFTLSIDDDGNLVIELSAAGKAIVDTRGADKAYTVAIALETKPFEGKETKTITNRATLFGEGGVPKYWSESESEATSFGDEAEVRKRLFNNADSDWAESADALMDGEGNLVQDIWVYRVQFIPHGSYNNVTIVPVLDNLPGAVEFLGFVDEADAATGDNPVAGPVEIGGNLVASYDDGTHVMTIQQKAGTKLDAAGGPFAAYFAVRVLDASGSIVNRIGDTSATIEPRPSVSVGDYVWLDKNRDGRQDSGEPGIGGVVLTIVGPDGQPVINVHGEPVGPATTDANGKYSFDDLPALSGDETYTVCIDRDASAEALKGYVPTKAGAGDREGDSSDWCASSLPGELHNDGDRDPTLDFGFVTKTYAVGDYVWIDTNKNGIQDSGEKPLAGVKVELLNAAGSVLATTSTDANGRYVFDNLEAGTYKVRFTLTDAQKAKYQFTSQTTGSNSAVDSDAGTADGLTRSFVLDDTNTSLTTTYEFRDIAATQGIDPTWDAGVIEKANSDVGAGNANQGNGAKTGPSNLARTGTNVTLAVVLSILAIWFGWVSLQISKGRRREA
ncbi:MAG: carboxypeptidase regulatory-like domain-containing protein [Microthrixaceae bacterium]|nr:carboxypeptidase regulatory-like domain-containing protein [Microthrixaceae bacterium]